MTSQEDVSDVFRGFIQSDNDVSNSTNQTEWLYYFRKPRLLLK